MTEQSKFTAYMCGIDFTDERAQPRGGNRIFLSPEAVVKHRHGGDSECLDECGIVEVEVSCVRWIRPQNIFGKKHEPKE